MDEVFESEVKIEGQQSLHLIHKIDEIFSCFSFYLSQASTI
jgi:hypothetical protein